MSSERDNELVSLRLKGWRLRALAERYGISKQRVSQVVQKRPLAALQARVVSELAEKRQEDEWRQAAAELRERNPTAPNDFLAAALDLSMSMLKRWPEVQPRGPMLPPLSSVIDRVVSLRQQGKLQREIAVEVGVRQQGISKILQEHHRPHRRRRGRRQRADAHTGQRANPQQ